MNEHVKKEGHVYWVMRRIKQKRWGHAWFEKIIFGSTRRECNETWILNLYTFHDSYMCFNSVFLGFFNMCSKLQHARIRIRNACSCLRVVCTSINIEYPCSCPNNSIAQTASQTLALHGGTTRALATWTTWAILRCNRLGSNLYLNIYLV